MFESRKSPWVQNKKGRIEINATDIITQLNAKLRAACLVSQEKSFLYLTVCRPVGEWLESEESLSRESNPKWEHCSSKVIECKWNSTKRGLRFHWTMSHNQQNWFTSEPSQENKSDLWTRRYGLFHLLWLCDSCYAAAWRTAAQRDGDFEESLPTFKWGQPPGCILCMI